MTTNWADIHAREYVDAPGCWKTCGGGFCCSNNHPDFDFKLLPTHGTTIVFMPQEYLWVRDHGRLLQPATPADKPRQLSFKVDEATTCSMVYMPCRLLGLCAGKIDKPLLCKVYPFIPVPAYGNTRERAVPASVFEATFEAMGWPTPCSVHRQREPHEARVLADAARSGQLSDAYVQFYLRLAGALYENYVAKLLANTGLVAKRGPEFWRAWEFAYLSGALIDRASLREKALTILAGLKAEYDGFELGHDVVKV